MMLVYKASTVALCYGDRCKCSINRAKESPLYAPRHMRVTNNDIFVITPCTWSKFP